MNKTKKITLIICVSLLSMFFLAKKEGFEVLANIKEMNVEFLILSLISFLGYLYMEALSFKYLLNKFGYLPKLRRTFYYAASDFFASSISPGGSAGQPMQYMVMTKDDISTADTVMSLFSFNAVYHIVMVMFAIISLFLGEAKIVNEIPAMKALFIYGMIAQISLVLLFFGLMFSRNRFPKLITKIFDFLSRFKFLKRKLGNKESLEHHFEEQVNGAMYLKNNPIIFLRLMVYMIPLLVCYYSVPYFVFKGFGVNQGYFHVLLTQFVIMLSLESVPIPGGAGIAEVGASSAYDILAPGMGFIVMILSRAFNYYFGLLVGGVTISVTDSKRVKVTREKKIKLKISKEKFLKKRNKKKYAEKVS